MARDERDLRKLSLRKLDNLRQEVIAEEVRRIEEDPKVFVVSATAPIEEDLKIVDAILANTDSSK
ncbi:hypothetical protein [Aliterella atlantica]|uniref:Uncharacterized protein n=1 Tax=Aliterella atlantica CENA595 TaxID=1618023 RepID=A0A0D9A044_9CYAN|nr:hypothetical protein [Aliterella atlantica]KJH72831.1 hypothetical protein UH38_04570 [Aliterella atlantica CENA595]